MIQEQFSVSEIAFVVIFFSFTAHALFSALIYMQKLETALAGALSPSPASVPPNHEIPSVIHRILTLAIESATASGPLLSCRKR